MTTPMVDLKGLRKVFGTVEVLKEIDMSVAKGQILSLIGPSGSGKSTLLRSINLLETPTGGEVWLDGAPVNANLKGLAYERHLNRLRREMQMVFQQFNLFPHLTVMQNLTIGPMNLLGLPKAEAEARGEDLLGKVGLAEKALVEEVNAVVKELAAEHITMLIVTHEMRFAAEVADWAVLMDDGLVVEEGPPDQLFSAPEQPRTRSFLRKHQED